MAGMSAPASAQDSVMRRLDTAHLLLNRITISRNNEYSTRSIELQLTRISQVLQRIEDDLPLSDAIPEFKELQVYGVMLEDISARLTAWRKQLDAWYTELTTVDTRLDSYTHDSAILRLGNDTLFLQFYLAEVNELRREWQQARTVTNTNLTRTRTLQLLVSKQYFLTVDLRSRIAWLRRQSSERIFRDERRLIHQGTTANPVREARITLRPAGPIIGYFISRNRNAYLFLVALAVAAFIALRRPGLPKNLTPPQPAALRNPTLHAIAYALLIALSIHPLLELHASTFPLAQLPLLAVLTLLFRLDWPKPRFRVWLAIGGTYLLLLLSRSLLLRYNNSIGLLLLGGLGVPFAWYAIRVLVPVLPFKALTRLACYTWLLLTGASILVNAFGRLSLARILITSATLGAIQGIGLAVTTEALSSLFSKESSIAAKLQQSFLNLFRVYAIIIWMLSLAINCNLYDYLRRQYRSLLIQPVHIGSFSFQLANILLFFLVLYVANLLQKILSLFYSTPGEHDAAETPRYGSRLAMFRLLILVTGFLLAVAASGVPMERLTIILGALSVGVGLGLQNLVNNLVSGFILIFERPFRIGDYIELNQKKGVVRDIGLRSSHLFMEEGGDLIMPNADLLSGEVINWTAKGRHIKISLPLTIEGDHPIEQLEPILRKVLTAQSGLAPGVKPGIWITSANGKTTSLTITAWVIHIARIQSIRIELQSALCAELKANGLNL